MKTLFVCLVSAGSLTTAFAQNYSIDWFTIAGGGTVSGGGYTLDGTVGQPDAGNLSGSGYDLAGGFWAGAAAAPTLSITRSGTQVVLSWAGTGFVVQSSDDVAGPWATHSPGVTADGVHYQVNAAINERKKYFRLRTAE